MMLEEHSTTMERRDGRVPIRFPGASVWVRGQSGRKASGNLPVWESNQQVELLTGNVPIRPT